MTHAELVAASVAWLKRNGCRVVLHDPFRTPLSEQPDAIGWRDGLSIVVEAKTSLSDFRVDASKPWRVDPAQGMGDWRFFIAPAGLLTAAPLPNGWGLIEFDGARATVVSGGPVGNANWWKFPFEVSNKRCETKMLISALAQPEARPKLGAIPRRGIDLSELVASINEEAVAPTPAKEGQA